MSCQFPMQSPSLNLSAIFEPTIIFGKPVYKNENHVFLPIEFQDKPPTDNLTKKEKEKCEEILEYIKDFQMKKIKQSKKD